MPRRRVAISSCFRMRFKWPRSGVSRPICFNHLQLGNEMNAGTHGGKGERGRQTHLSMVVIWRWSGISTTHACAKSSFKNVN